MWDVAASTWDVTVSMWSGSASMWTVIASIWTITGADSSAVKRKKVEVHVKSLPRTDYPGSCQSIPTDEINNARGLEGLHAF